MSSAFRNDAAGWYIKKRVNDILDYSLIWADWLVSGDVIETSLWSGPAGITLNSPSINGAPVTIDGVSYAANTVAMIWASAGTAGASYEIVNKITTTGGRTKERKFRIVIET